MSELDLDAQADNTRVDAARVDAAGADDSADSRRVDSGPDAPAAGDAIPGGRPAVVRVAHDSLSAEDAKLVILARSARLRAYVPRGGTATAEGAAVRDTDGRTYVAATVENARERLTVSALAAAVVAAASSGARRFEAAAIVSDRLAGPLAGSGLDTADTADTASAPDVPAAAGAAGTSAAPGVPGVPGADDLLVLGEFGTGVPVFLAGSDGVARGRVTT
ncbi:hypothetical protein [Candidatus Protofrankia datiscae]|uniref:hypothetical protein n=1 Tax=Protofrankia TaxID=2994361 RepID=UPI0002E9AA7F